MKAIKRILISCLMIFFALLLLAVGYYCGVTRNAKLSPEKLLFTEKNITLYDKNGEVVRGVTAPLFKQTTAIEKIPQHTKNAFINVEDKRFYKHSGYDLKGIVRASLHNLKSGSFKEGASTISQQLIKNTHLSQEKTLKRKLKEWKLTRALERAYTKEEILEKYLNTIYFGHSCFGITSAAEFYFGKTPSDLSISESAILAGLVKSPNHYSPFKNPESCKHRRDTVLNVMLANGSITKEEKTNALLAPLPIFSEQTREGGYAHFVFDELTTIAEENQLQVGGQIEIFTYLDQIIQKEVEEIAAAYTKSDKTILLFDKKNHGFKACVSTVGNIKRSPASLIKPLLVYAPAIEENLLSPATPILDCKVNYSGYAPENYDGEYHGYVSARECVEKSLNIPAVKTLEALTLKMGAEYLAKMGLPILEEDKSLALALGGMKNGFTLRDVVSAYSTLEKGVYDTCGFISHIRINGKTVYKKLPNKKRVLGEDTAYLMTDMLKTTAQKGTAKKLRSLPFEIAAKTGTGGTKAGNTDAYALSYTTKDCAAVWLGNADNSPIACTGGGAPCNLLLKINEALYRQYKNHNIKIASFEKPKSVQTVDLDKSTYYDTHTLSLADDISPVDCRISELFKSNAIPLHKSISFTSPSIPTPQLQRKEKGVLILFDEKCLRQYTYKIERYDYVTHTTLYEGAFLPSFFDERLPDGKNFIYTVTPIYEGHHGEPITLPTVSTKQGSPPPRDDSEILSKEWWDY